MEGNDSQACGFALVRDDMKKGILEIVKDIK